MTGVILRVGRDDAADIQICHDDTLMAPSIFTDESSEHAGASVEAGHWPSVHPGPLNASTGYKELTAVLEFEMTEVVEPLDLHIRARGASGPCPDLRVTLNGVPGFVLTRQSRLNRAHDPMPPSPTAGVIDRRITLPIALLRPGLNTIAFTTICLDTPSLDELLPPRRPDLKVWFGSALLWDEIALSVREPAPVELQIEPLPLYISENGVLQELVDVMVFNAGSTDDGSVAVSGAINDRIDLAEWPYEFGDVRMRCRVPDTGTPFSLSAELSVPAGQTLLEERCVPARKWTVHLIPHVHLDVGFTDLPARVTELHNRNLDKALTLIAERPEYRFVLDTAMQIEDYARTRSAARVEQVFEQLRTGRLSVNPMYVNLLTQVADFEDLIRSFYYAAELERAHGIPRRYGNVTDVPTYTQAMPSVLRAEGIEWFVGVVDHIRGGNARSDEMHLASPVRWLGPDGASVLSFFTDCYTQLRFVCGDPPTLAGVAQSLTEMLRRYDRPNYLPADIPLFGTNSDNEDLATGYADLVDRWSSRFEWPRIRYSTPSEYFERIAPFEDELAEWHGDGGSYWEDGVGTQAVATADLRRSQALMPAVEGISALTAMGVDGVTPDLPRLDQAWRRVLLGAEHTWAADISTSHPNAERSRETLATSVHSIVSGRRLMMDEAHRAASQLAEQVTVDTIPAIVAVNGLGWSRDLELEIELQAGEVLLRPDGSIVPTAPLETEIDGRQRRRALLTGVPAFGYESLAVYAGKPRSSDGRGSEDTLRRLRKNGTEHYFVDIDPVSGAVRSLKHKHLQREVLDTASITALGHPLYVLGGGTPVHRGLGSELNALNDYDPTLRPVDFDIASAAMSLEAVERTPWSWVIRSRGAVGALTDIALEIEFLDTSAEVRVSVHLHKNPNLAKESVYIPFPFALEHPAVSFDRQLGWVDPTVDHYPGAGSEWFTTFNAVVLEGQGLGVEWSSAEAPLFTLTDIVRATWPTAVRPRTGHIFSWAMNNYWFTNTAATQSGSLNLRYVFEPVSAPSRGRAWRRGQSLRTPGLTSTVIQNDRCGPLEREGGRAGALLDFDADPNIAVTVFAGRNESELVVRLRDIAGTGGRVSVAYPDRLLRRGPAWVTRLTPTETVIGELSMDSNRRIRIDIPPSGVVTIGLGHTEKRG